ncbi:MAG: hypothetical protein OEN00_18415, partial [Gemmatimonadota bacterium]|nr:hypothetical protein [Gemmatimonadota bacterium]
RFEEILANPEELAHGVDVFTKSVNRIRVALLDRRIQELQQRLEAAATDDEKGELAGEKARLARELRELDRNYWKPATRPARSERNPNPPSR